jgi:tRNA G46 methylase TrmB
MYKTNDLDCLNEDNIMTEYEKKFHNRGVKINKVIARKENVNKKT